MNPLSAFPINTQMSTNITIDIRINIRREPRTIPAISKPLPLGLSNPFFILTRSIEPNIIGIIDIPTIPVTNATIENPLGPL